MATQTFEQAMNNAEEMVIHAPDGREIQGNYCDPKLDRGTLPEGWHAYDIRHDDDGCGIFCELCHDYVIANNAGTFFLQGDIPELAEAGSFVSFEIEEDDWLQMHGVDLDDPDPADVEAAGPCPESKDTDWGYSFL